MAEIKLSADKRDSAGKGSARRARAAGKVPAILYGRGMESVAIQVDRRELVTAFHTDAGMNVLLDLQVDGTTTLAITRELQRDPVKGTLLHADFVKVDRKTKIEVDVPVNLTGEAQGAREGGVLEHPLFQVQVRCLPTAVPEAVNVDVSALNIGDVLRVADLSLAEGIEVLNDPEIVVALVAQPISEEQLEAMEAGAGIEQEAPAEAEGGAAAEAEEAAEAEQGKASSGQE